MFWNKATLPTYAASYSQLVFKKLQQFVGSFDGQCFLTVNDKKLTVCADFFQNYVVVNHFFKADPHREVIVTKYLWDKRAKGAFKEPDFSKEDYERDVRKRVEFERERLRRRYAEKLAERKQSHSATPEPVQTQVSPVVSPTAPPPSRAQEPINFHAGREEDNWTPLPFMEDYFEDQNQ